MIQCQNILSVQVILYTEDWGCQSFGAPNEQRGRKTCRKAYNLNEPGLSKVREDGAEKYIIMNYWVYGARGESLWRLVDE